MPAVIYSSSPATGVASRLRTQARERPHQVAVWELEQRSWQKRTFRELDQLVDRTCHALVRAGITRGMRTVLMIPPGREFLVCTFALMRIGAPPVLVDPGMGIAGLGRCLGRANPQAFIGVPRAHRARVLLRWAASSVKHRISVGHGWIPPFTRRLEKLRDEEELNVPFSEPVLESDETAAILFTSGSTGPAKGAISHQRLIETQVDWIARIHGIEAGEVDLPTFPLFGLFSVALGMTSVVPRMDFTRPAEADPQHLLDLIDRFGVTSLFASPALLGNLSRYLRENSRSMSGLRRIISAGAPARHEEIEQLLPSLPAETHIETPYGATEAMPLCCIGHQEFLDSRRETELGAGICVGSVVQGVQIRICPEGTLPRTGSSVADGEAGEIWASGDIVSRSYFDDSVANELHKFIDSDGNHWHRTGDLGNFDSIGRIWFRGRNSQVVRTASGDLHTVAIERVFDVHPSVRRSALVGRGKKGQQVPILCIEKAPSSQIDEAQLIRELKKIGSTVKGADQIEHFFFPGPFPVDIRHNAKIDREALGISAGQVFR